MESVLMNLLGRGENEMIVKILGDGCRVNFGNSDALRKACNMGNNYIIGKLVECGAEIFTKRIVNDKPMFGPLGIVIMKNNMEGLKILIAKSNPIDNVLGLILSITFNNRDIFDIMIKTELDIQYDFNKALRTACKIGEIYMVKSLIENGADVNSIPEDDDFSNSLVVAISEKHIKIIPFLLEFSNSTTNYLGMVSCIKSYNRKIFDLLIYTDFDINFNQGELIRYVCSKSYQDKYYIIKQMILRGADINLSHGYDGNLFPAFISLILNGETDLVKLFIESGVSKPLINTGLIVSISENKEDIINILLYKADVTFNDSECLLAASNNLPMIKKLISLGANPNSLHSIDNIPTSPAKIAAQNNNPEILHYLLSHNLDQININLALETAISLQHLNIIQLIYNHISI